MPTQISPSFLKLPISVIPAKAEIHAIRIKNLENRIENFNFSFLNSIILILITTLWPSACARVTARCGSQARLCLGSPSFRNDGIKFLHFVNHLFVLLWDSTLKGNQKVKITSPLRMRGL